MSDVKPSKYDGTTMREVLEWCSENVTDAWTASQWAVYLRGREPKGPAHFTASTLYEALHAAWSSRGEKP